MTSEVAQHVLYVGRSGLIPSTTMGVYPGVPLGIAQKPTPQLSTKVNDKSPSKFFNMNSHDIGLYMCFKVRIIINIL